ncbi:Hypothetical protein A7982_02260 [Minicystis rosea]|nr:Hypothetical protein A7982_02260 [Minicystis rosea]
MASQTAQIEAKLTRLAKKAAKGDKAAADQVLAGLAELVKAPAPRAHVFPTPASAIFAVVDAFVSEDEPHAATLRRLAGPFLDAISARPEHYGIPWAFKPAESVGVAAIPHLAEALDRGLALTSPAEIEALGRANPMNVAGFALAENALNRLFAYDDAADRAAEAVVALPWTDDRLWLVFRVLSGGYGGSFSGVASITGAVARNILAKLVTKTASIEGPGATKLRALLVRAKVIPKSSARGAAPAKLPKQLPLDVPGALALLETWKLSAADVEAGAPAKAREITSLEKQLGRALPSDLAELLAAHGSIGDREIGPPARMKELLGELEGMIEEHEEEADEAPSGKKGDLDIRAFDPLKTGIPLGTDVSGDLYFLATGATSEAGTAPVIRFRHDQALVAAIAADSLGEYVAIVFARVFARREGLERELEKIEERKRRVVSGYTAAKKKRAATRA